MDAPEMESKEELKSSDKKEQCLNHLAQMELKIVDSVPFIPECEVFNEGGPDARQLYDTCSKNSGHTTFIPVNEFTKEHLPLDCQTDNIMNYIKWICDRTVKITVNICSKNRPVKYPNSNASYPYYEYRGSDRVARCGTGFIGNILPSVIKGECPCPTCKISKYPMMEYLVVQVDTAAHVIFDGTEARSAVCELFYDSHDMSGIKYLYGVNVWDFKEYCNCGFCNFSSDENDDDDDKCKSEKCYYDAILIKCVTHDQELIALLSNMCNEETIPSFPLELIVSHPHGNSKQITIGKTLRHILPIPMNHSPDTPFRLGRHTKCQLVKNAPPSSKEIFELLSYLDSSYLQGDVLVISESMTAFLPENAPYIYQVVRSSAGSHSFCSKWVQFPLGTSFVHGNGTKEDSFALPDTEFQLTKPDNTEPDMFKPFYVVYDIDTCPGCSGAPIMIMDEEGPYIKSHSGALADGTNRSEVS